MALPTNYAIGAGWNVADGSLTTIPELLRAYTVPYMGTTIEPRAGVVNTFPIRSLTLDGSERGDGMIGLTWLYAAMPIVAYRYWVSTFFSGGTVMSVPVTIVTAQYETSAIWKKYNAYMQLPVQGVDYIFDSQYVLNLNQRFNDLIAI